MAKKDVKIHVNDIDKWIKIIKIDGELDTFTSTHADEIITPFIDEGKNIIIDCTNLSYVNSAGLALLLKYYIQMKRRNRELKIVNPNKFIYEMMDISGVLKLLEVYKTQEEAIESLKEAKWKR